MSNVKRVFDPTGDTFDIDHNVDPNAPPPSKKRKDIPLRIPTYRLITFIDGSPQPHSNEEYCCLGSSYSFDRFILLDTLRTRLQNRDDRDKDRDAMLKSGGTKAAFTLWDKAGDVAILPRGLVIDPEDRKYKDPNAWDAAQLEKWRDVAQGATKRISGSFNTYLRFFLPQNVKDVTIYFTPNTAVLDAARLRTVVNDVVANSGVAYKVEVLDDFNAAVSKDLKLIGQHFLDFYCTWIKAQDYQTLWNGYKKLWPKKGTNKLGWPFPGDGKDEQQQYITLQDKLKVPADKVDAAPATFINSKKIKSAGSNRGSKQDQVMNYQSATVVSEALWPDTKGSATHVAEWLHRTAFRFGGLGDSTTAQSAQVPSNLVFGSVESNTHMIRAENTISKLFEWETGLTGTLVTTNVRRGQIARITTTGDRIFEQIPSWVDKEKYSWLCFRLRYQWSMVSMLSRGGYLGTGAINMPLNVMCAFDPWSQYMPLRLEAEIDDALVDSIYKQYASPSTVSALPQSLGIPPQTNARKTIEVAFIWKEIAVQPESIVIDGIKLFHPRIASPPALPYDSFRTFDNSASPEMSPESGFVVQGEIELFGVPGLMAKFEKWEGEVPDIPGEVPLIERATLERDFHISLVVPQLEGTVFDKIIFRNVAFYRQNHLYDQTRAIGWHFDADWVIDENCGLLYDVLSKTLGIKEPILSIHAGLGQKQSWNERLNVHSLTLEGIFPDLSISPVDGLCFSSIGVRLLAIRELAFAPNPRYALKYEFSVFGTMEIKIPSSVVPLTLEYDITTFSDLIKLSASVSGEVWNDVLGVEGLLLQDVLFTTSFSLSSPWKSLAFDVSAIFQYKFTRTILLGSYAVGSTFMLSSTFQNVDASFVNDIFEFISCDMLSLPEFKLEIEQATLTIASGEGLSIDLKNVRIADYNAVDASLSFSSTGVMLMGKISGTVLDFGEIEIRDPFLKVAFASASSRKKTDVMVGGTVRFSDSLSLSAAAHLYRIDNRTEWTILAELSAKDDTMALSKIVPDIKGSFLDLALKHALFIVASRDDPALDAVYSSTIIRKGVQFCAMLEPISCLDTLMRKSVSGLVLRVGWSKTEGFNLDVLLPAELVLEISPGITTTPVRLGVATKPSVELSLSAGLRIALADSPDPLLFSLILAANVYSASAAAELKGWINKPFGLQHISIGPDIGLSIEIIYVQFIATGTPSGFGAKGGLRIGEVNAQFAINISEDPKRQLLSGKVEKLDIADVVEFASQLINVPIREVPHDFLKFENANLYICPAGIRIGTTFYPQGFSFAADMILFGKRANISCLISEVEKYIQIDGGVDNFQLGPLSVRGLKGPRAEVHCTIGATKQYLYIDGAVRLWELEIQLSIQLQLLPSPIFNFHTQLQFANLFLVRLDAELVGAVNFKSLNDADFVFDATLQNMLLEYIREQVMEQFSGARDAAKEGIEKAQKAVDEARREYENGIKQAQDDVRNALENWSKHNKDIREKSQPVIDNYLKTISQLQSDIDEAKKVYNKAMADAQRAVRKANEDRAAALAAARRDVANAKADMDRGINQAQRVLDYAEADLRRAFGDAQRAIDNAQRRVWSLYNEINGLWRIVREYQRAPWYEFQKKVAIPGLMIAIGGLEAAKGVAIGVLEAAKAVLRGAEFLSKEAAVSAARAALEAARYTGYAGLETANAALVAADKTSQAAVDLANKTLKAVEYGVEYVAFQGAIEALEVFKRTNEAIYKAAVTAIENLLESVQYIAYQVALNALEIAKSATTILDAANEMLELAKEASRVALDALEAIIKFGTTAVDIQLIKLSGSLRGIIGSDGKTSKPLSAKIKGYFLGKAFELDAEFNPTDAVTFITSIFNGLWKGIVGENALATSRTLSFAEATEIANQHFVGPTSAKYKDIARFRDIAPLERTWADAEYPIDPYSPYRLEYSIRAPSLPLGEPMINMHTLGKALKIEDQPVKYIPTGPFTKRAIGPTSVTAWTAATIMQKFESVDIHDNVVDIGVED